MVQTEPFNWILRIFIISVVFVSLIDAKRTFNVGRMRNKSANPNVRRKGFDQPAEPVEIPKVSASSAAAFQPNLQVASFHSGMSLYQNGHHPRTDGATSYGYATRYPSGLTNIEKIPPKSTTNNNDTIVTSFNGLDQEKIASIGGPSHIARNQHNTTDQTVHDSGHGYGPVSANPHSFGNLLSGLAIWNMAREFNSYNNPSHHQTQHNKRDGGNQEMLVNGDRDVSKLTAASLPGHTSNSATMRSSTNEGVVKTDTLNQLVTNNMTA